MIIREATRQDVLALTTLFAQTIRETCTKDYTSAQINAWCEAASHLARWQSSIEKDYFLVFEEALEIRGFASLSAQENYLDSLYVHKDYQRRGIATLLLDRLEQRAKLLGFDTIWSDVSITARPFFLHHGFSIDRIYQKQFQGLSFTNAIMIKQLS